MRYAVPLIETLHRKRIITSATGGGGSHANTILVFFAELLLVAILQLRSLPEKDVALSVSSIPVYQDRKLSFRPAATVEARPEIAAAADCVGCEDSSP